jgi:hypothetical protein
MLQMVHLNALAKRDVSGPRQVIVLSDLMHHNKQLSMYRDVPPYDAFAQSDYGHKTRISFKDTDVQIWLIQNTNGAKQKRVTEFWQRYFQDNGATSVNLELLPG